MKPPMRTREEIEQRLEKIRSQYAYRMGIVKDELEKPFGVPSIGDFGP
jgi:hypothetical protein